MLFFLFRPIRLRHLNFPRFSRSTFCFEIENFSVWQFHHLRRFASSFITAKMELNRKSKAKNCAESPDSKKRRESDPIFDDCKLIQAKKAQIKLLKNQTEKRKAQLHRDIGIIAMTKEVDGAFEKALEYLTKSWKVCKTGCPNKF